MEEVLKGLHLCIGVCGEPCIQICRYCNVEKFKELCEDLTDHESGKDQMFIQLGDCRNKCIFDVGTLDSLFSNDAKEGITKIVTLECPRCKTPIRNSRRYSQELKQQFLDIQQIKRLVMGNPQEMQM